MIGMTHEFDPNLLEACRYLLTCDNVMKEAEYFSGLAKYSDEPSETLWIIRTNAWVAVEMVESGEAPPDDALLFIAVEERIRLQQQQAHDRDVAAVRKWLKFTLLAILLPIAGLLGWVEVLVASISVERSSRQSHSWPSRNGSSSSRAPTESTCAESERHFDLRRPASQRSSVCDAGRRRELPLSSGRHLVDRGSGRHAVNMGRQLTAEDMAWRPGVPVNRLRWS